MTLVYGSVCSGIEAASVAWHPLGWKASFLSEIDAFPRAVLSHHYPDVSLHGDFTTISEGDYAAIDVLVGGTPCQSFSVAGLRGGLADGRGNLALEYLLLAKRLRPKWLVWENVPGVLSSAGGRDFGSILGGMGELGYGFAYRVLDAQYVRINGFGRAVPQRRRRVFVVGYLGDWRRAAAVLFERESLCGNPPPRREAGKGSAPTLSARTKGGGRLGTDFDLDGGLIGSTVPIDMRQASRGEKITNNREHGSGGAPGHGVGNVGDPAFTVSERGQAIAYVATRDAAATLTRGAESSGKGGYAGRRQEDDDNLVARCDTARQTRIDWETETFIPSVAGTMPAAGGTENKHGHGWGQQEWESGYCVAHALRADGFDASEDGTGRGTPLVPVEAGFMADDYEAGTFVETDTSNPVTTSADRTRAAPIWSSMWRVRRLTPTECERLQGFPDGYTAIPYRGKPAADGPRYKALGNSMAVNVMRWIGKRIDSVESLARARAYGGET